MVFSSLRKVSLVFSSRQSLIVCDQSATSQQPVGDQSATSRQLVGDNRYKLEGSEKTCRRTVDNWSQMRGDLCVMVGDSRTISTDLLLTNCGPPVIRPVLHSSPIKNLCDCHPFLSYPFLSPMVAGGLWWSPTILVVGGWEPVLTQV